MMMNERTTKGRLIYPRFVLLILLIVTGVNAHQLSAQSFQPQEIDLPLTVDTIIAAELTQDERIDYWIAGTDTNGVRGYWIYQNQGGNKFDKKLITTETLDAAVFALADIDRDNQLDAIVSGQTETGESLTQIYYNNSGFTAPPTMISQQRGSWLACADFNQDGRLDIFLDAPAEQNNQETQVLIGTDEGFEAKAIAIPPMVFGRTLAYDWNNDGDVDILRAGKLANGELETRIYQNQGGLRFERYDAGLPALLGTALAVGDINQDGYADLLVSGQDVQDEAMTHLYQYADSLYQPVAIDLPDAVSSFATLADYNHDGLTDIGLVGVNALATGVARWYFQTDSVWNATVYDAQVASGAVGGIGDVDEDGHLDVLWSGTATSDPVLWINGSPGDNLGPSAPINPLVSTVDTLTVFRWEAGTDDQTNPVSFTYEMSIISEASDRYALSPEFADTTKARVDHGRAGYGNEYTVSGLPEGTYEWDVAPVDNAFHLGVSCAGGGGSGGPLCFTINRDDTTVCVGTELLLSASTEVQWKSNRGRSLTPGRTLTYTVRDKDVIYYTATSDTACALTYSLLINTLPAEPNDLLAADTTVCDEATMVLSVDEPYDSITWFSASEGQLATGNTLEWTVAKADTLWVRAQTLADACPVWDTMNVMLYPPAELLTDRSVSLEAGASVTLVARGAVEYQWAPPDGLNRTDIASPVASPTETTTYVVTGRTVNGCLLRDTVTINVTTTRPSTDLFVPNLFSPNGDGQNDLFRLYGDVASIVWQVYDRQGTQLFEADRLDAGWNGQYQGRDLPTGVYIWKLSGKQVDGSSLQFDGAQSGMLRLVR